MLFIWGKPSMDRSQTGSEVWRLSTQQVNHVHTLEWTKQWSWSQTEKISSLSRPSDTGIGWILTLSQISATPKVRSVFQEVTVATHTLVPEMFRNYNSNGVGVLTHPTQVCCGPDGVLFMVDASEGTAVKARSTTQLMLTLLWRICGRHRVYSMVVEYSSSQTPRQTALFIWTWTMQQCSK